MNPMPVHVNGPYGSIYLEAWRFYIHKVLLFTKNMHLKRQNVKVS